MIAPTAILGGPTEGERRKSDVLTELAARREVYVNRGRRALLITLIERGEATADDVRRAVELPDGISAVCLGAVPGELARRGIVQRVGFATTARPEAHARPVSIWALRDRAAALRWLTAHPDRRDPVEDADEGFLFSMGTRKNEGPTVAAAGLS